ncbi:butyrate kinase [Myxococcota bacterium]|nr:butyrate kinase [Myxococcota bacterium]MBU1535281.1 butyrate kinase [Myxococcota bacterium]
MTELYTHLMETAAEAVKASRLMSAHGKRVEELIRKWIKSADEEKQSTQDMFSDLKGIIELLDSDHGFHGLNDVLGEALTRAIAMERGRKQSSGVMERLLDPVTLGTKKPVVLVINPGSTSTKVAWFEGLIKVDEFEIHLAADVEDTVLTRTDTIIDWIEERELPYKSLTGIACRGGFINAVPSGTYRVCTAMVEDLQHPRIVHASNMSILIGRHIAKYLKREGELLITTSDPVVCDELEVVERMSGYIKIKKDGTGVHYLNHKAVVQLIASVMGKNSLSLSCVTAHIGGGCSVARHKNGVVTSVVDAFSGIPSANRSGQLDIPRVLDALDTGEMTLKELKSVTFSRGGLLSLAGTNDFRALSAFVGQGATPEQIDKIQLIFEFYARQIARAVMGQMGDGQSVSFVALTGGLAHSTKITDKVIEILGDRVPVVVVPGSIEHESLAANLMKGIVRPEHIQDYVRARDGLNQTRREENRLLDLTVFQRPLLYRKHGSPIRTLDELIDSVIIKVKENFTPIIGIVGADNEEAILAAKRANQEGMYRIAKFRLIGDYSAISKIAYDYDLIIDNDNFIIDDHEDPVARGVELFASGEVHILMKGSMHTDEILRGIFKYLKGSGKLKKGELISHCVVMDIPMRNKLTIISDAAVNPYPDKDKKLKIIDNAIRVASYLNVNKPKIAVISAIENVNQSVASSMEADVIAHEFHGPEGVICEGPLSLDVAMDNKIALEKHYPGQIKGNADILIMPDIDAGNILYKTLTTQSGAVCAGIILAGDIPIILTSRGDSARSKLASISLSVAAYFKNKEHPTAGE